MPVSYSDFLGLDRASAGSITVITEIIDHNRVMLSPLLIIYVVFLPYMGIGTTTTGLQVGNSAGWGNPDGFGVRVSTGQRAGQRLMTVTPTGQAMAQKNAKNRQKTRFLTVFRVFLCFDLGCLGSNPARVRVRVSV
jgi:hypothetical protein